MKEYRFDYSVTVAGRTHSALKRIKAHGLTDACRRLAAHACRQWATKPMVAINGIYLNGEPINPDLRASCDFELSCEVSRQYT